MKTSRLTLIVCFYMCIAFSLYAQKSKKKHINYGQTVSLVVSGTAKSEDEAIKIALRSAIEQTFGTFVSTNTQIVNDDLVKDEIVSVTSGNIEKYSLISSEKESDGSTSVSVKATVSIDNLVQFAQSKGSSTELAGATFAMNMKMRKLNKENEYRALLHMLDKMIKISELNLFDYSISNETPQVIISDNHSLYGIPTKIKVRPNENYNNLVNVFRTTIQSLSIPLKEIQEYDDTKDVYYKYGKMYSIYGKGSFKLDIEGYNHEDEIITDCPMFYLRNSLETSYLAEKLRKLRLNIWKSSMSFSIKDNLGNSSVPICVSCAEKIFYTRKPIIETGCDWPIWIDSKVGYYHKVLFIYGITSSKESYDKNFMGGSQSYISGYNFNVSKMMYFSLHEHNDDQKEERVWNRYYRYHNGTFNERGIVYAPSITLEEFGRGFNYIFSSQDLYNCLNLSGKVPYFPYSIYLYYNEKDIEKLSSITISPVSPNEFVIKQIELD